MFQVKINGQNEEMLRAAIEQFGDKTDDEIAFGNIFFTIKKRFLPPEYMFSEIWNNTFALTYQGILCIHKIVCEKIDNLRVE